MTWRAHICGPNRHVWPVDDTREHVTDGRPCWCHPTDDDGVLVHHSADGRERVESGAREARTAGYGGATGRCGGLDVSLDIRGVCGLPGAFLEGGL